MFPPTRRLGIERALEDAMQRLRVRDPEAFVALLAENGAVFDEVMHHLTIGETYFFREPAQFDVLRETVLPLLRETDPDRERTFWSAACATGEEAYSLAILARGESVNARVLGTDVDRTRIAAARHGRYRQWSLRGLTPDQITSYFTRTGQDYCLRAEIRREVAFSPLNLVEDDFPAPATGAGLDVIFCRNVLIYFSPDTIANVCRRLIESLSPAGWLFVGASDPLVMNHVDCDVVQTPAGLAYRRRSAASRRVIRTPVVPVAPVLPVVSWTADAPAPVTAAPAPPAPLAVPPSPMAPAIVEDAIGVAYVARDYDRAISLGAAALGNRTATLQDLALTVRAYGNVGRIQDAERFCMAALDRAPESAELYALHAMLLLQAGHPNAAATAARRALYLDRDCVIARVSLGDALARLADPTAACRAYATALKSLVALDPLLSVPGTDGESRERMIGAVRDRLKPLERAS